MVRFGVIFNFVGHLVKRFGLIFCCRLSLKKRPCDFVIRFAAGESEGGDVAAGSCLRATGLGVVDHRGGDGAACGQATGFLHLADVVPAEFTGFAVAIGVSDGHVRRAAAAFARRTDTCQTNIFGPRGRIRQIKKPPFPSIRHQATAYRCIAD